MGEALDSLRTELGAEPSAALTELDDDAQRRLAALVASARRRQQAELERAIDHGLGFVPRLARGAVKKAMLG
jgi:hypothetical protein